MNLEDGWPVISAPQRFASKESMMAQRGQPSQPQHQQADTMMDDLLNPAGPSSADPASRLEEEAKKRRPVVQPEKLAELQGWQKSEQSRKAAPTQQAQRQVIPREQYEADLQKVLDRAASMMTITGALGLVAGVGIGWWLFGREVKTVLLDAAGVAAATV